MIKRKNWTKKMLAVAACAGLLMTNPAFTEAATAAERSAYQAVFDADYYRSAYPDVAAAFGNNKAALFKLRIKRRKKLFCGFQSTGIPGKIRRSAAGIW